MRHNIMITGGLRAPSPQPEQIPSEYPLRHNMDDSASGHDRRPKYAAAGVPDRWGGPMMDRGEVWWALLDEKRPVVLLSRDGAEELRAIQVVAPAGTDITDVGIEVRLGNGEGLANEGVVRVALPRTGFIPCTWLVTLTRDDLIEQAGRLSPAKLHELADALRLAQLE
jgi:mRNA interferase MazF